MQQTSFRSTAEQRTLTSDAAQAGVTAALAHACALGIRVNAAAVDAGGALLAFRRMDGAFLHSIDIAIDKACTAASFGFATEDWLPLLEADAALKAGLPQRPRLVVFGGGVPAYAGAQVAGAIGVSGGSAEQDAACARAGLAAIGLHERPQ